MAVIGNKFIFTTEGRTSLVAQLGGIRFSVLGAVLIQGLRPLEKEDGESGILTMILRLIKVSHHCGDVRFEETIAEYKHRQTTEHQPHGERIIYRRVYCSTFRKNAH